MSFKSLLILPISLIMIFTQCTTMKEMVSSIIACRDDGKMNIPKHLKHVRLDIGLSNHAPMSQYWLTHEDDLVVFGFEPHPGSVDAILQGKVKRYELVLDPKFVGNRFFLFPCALGLSNSPTVKFYITGNDSVSYHDCGTSSIYKPKCFDVIQVIDVPIFSLENFFDLFPFDTHPVIDYIKIDTQGADLDIAKSAGHYLAERVIYITIEAEDSAYENTNNSELAIENHMKGLGFVRYFHPQLTDPTYFNPRFSEYAKKHDIQIFKK